MSASVCCSLRGGEEPKKRVRATQWAWVLPGDRYKTLSMFERAQYDKAATFLKSNDFRAAAAEFEKFKVQFQDSATTSTLAYVNFMYGYCLYQAKDRNAAIKAFTEVLDYFKNEADDAAASLFFKGLALLDNGDTRKGLQCMQQMVEDPDHRYHPLAAGALRRLAENYWKQKQADLAVKYWKQVCADFWQANPEEAKEARNAVTNVYLQQGDYAGYEGWLIGDANRENAQHRRWVAVQAQEVAMWVFDANNYGPLKRDAHLKDARAFLAWFKAQKPWFEKGNDVWTFYDRGINFLTQRLPDKKERNDMVAEVSAFVRAARDNAKDDNARNDAHNKLAWLVDRLCEMGDFTQAQLCADTIADPPYAAYKGYEVLARRQKWTEGVAKLQEIEKSPNQYWAGRAKEERARVYRECTGEYEKAIKLYQEIDKPPGTLWSIQDAYKRWGKVKEALTTLTEIENSFPDQAAAAAWRKVQYLEEAGDKTAAISGCRRILKLYKGAGESSAAHQLLEKYGIKTGGGVFEGGE
ncbi:MAG: tetratricopeptide repeat protein [Planctomycetota bacterium]|nr:tetratricopeptide repeat protein [Planctomycetota bacterium]